MMIKAMVINKEQFQENFKFFDKEIIVEIIDLFIGEFDDRMKGLKDSIESSDMAALKFNAHSLKGVISNFVADEPRELAKILEEKASQKDKSDLVEIYHKLYASAAMLVDELKDIRIIYAN